MTKVEVKIPVKLRNKIKKVAKIQAAEKKLSNEKKLLKEEIKQFMEENELTEIVANLSKALLTEYDKTTFDTDLLKAERPKLYEKYLKTTHSTRFEVKDAKVGK